MKKSLTILLALALLLPSVIFGSAADLTEVPAEAPAITAQAGETVDLTGYAYVSDGTSTPLSEYSWSSEDCEITGSNQVTVAEKGVYCLTGEKEGKQIRVYIVAAEEGDEDFVLYEEDFDEFTAEEQAEYTKLSGNFTVADGKMTLTPGTIVLLPEFLGDFGNYRIDVTGTMLSATEGTRWSSVMFRVQNSLRPYYQMCVRQTATASNGVEFAEMTPASQWSVTNTASFTEAISSAKSYTFTVKAYGNIVEESINGQVLIYAENADKYDTGRIGVQTNGSTLAVDSIRVCLQLSKPERAPSNSVFADTRDPESNLNTTPAIMSYINSAADLDGIMKNSPATAIAKINKDGNIVAADGSTICGIEEYVEKLDKKVIAGFMPEDKAAIDKIKDYITSSGMDDVTVFSDDLTLIKYARSAHKMIRTAVIFDDTALEEGTLMDIRETVNGSGSRVAILPPSLATKENVTALQKLLITVWTFTEGEESDSALMKLVLSGASGIIVSDRAALESCFTKYFEPDSFTRPVWIIGHRGVPSLAPENTVEGSVLAAENGADIVENDIYYTTDGEIVVLHDGTLDRTTNGSGNVESMTLEQVRQYVIDTHPSYKDVRIPTLDEYFEEFKGKETHIFIEVKSGNVRMVDKMIDLIEEYEIADQVSVISFNASQLQLINRKAPYLSTGYLCSGVTSTQDDIENVRRAYQQTLSYGTTFNQSFSGMTSEFVAEYQRRGSTIWPWTFGSDVRLLLSYMHMGLNGLTTDNCQQMKGVIEFVTADNYDYVMKNGESLEIPVKITTYDNKQYSVSDDSLVFVSGNDVVKLEDGKITALKDGTATFFYLCKTSCSGVVNYVASPLFTVTVGEQQNGAESVGATTPGSGLSTGTIILICAGAAVIVAAVIAAIVLRSKKNNA